MDVIFSPVILLRCLSAEVVLGIQLVCVLVTVGVGEQVHAGPRVEHLKSGQSIENTESIVIIKPETRSEGEESLRPCLRIHCPIKLSK